MSGSSPVDGTVSSDSCYTILTATVPRYACWLVCVVLNVEIRTNIWSNLTDLCWICDINIAFSLTFDFLLSFCFQMESDVKQSEQAQQLTKVGSKASAHSTTGCLSKSFMYNLMIYIICFKQDDDGTCLGKVLTAADAAYVLSSSHLSAPEEGEHCWKTWEEFSIFCFDFPAIIQNVFYSNFDFRKDHFLFWGTVYPFSIWKHHYFQGSHQQSQVLQSGMHKTTRFIIWELHF